MAYSEDGKTTICTFATPALINPNESAAARLTSMTNRLV